VDSTRAKRATRNKWKMTQREKRGEMTDDNDDDYDAGNGNKYENASDV